MHSTSFRRFATTSSYCDRATIKTPQRRANYKDKERLRLKDLKRIAFKEYGCSSTAEVKQLLLQLKIKLDLRLTSAWEAIVFELRSRILNLPKPGSKVLWENAPAYLHSWGALEVLRIVNDCAVLELWSGDPVPLYELELAA